MLTVVTQVNEMISQPQEEKESISDIMPQFQLYDEDFSSPSAPLVYYAADHISHHKRMDDIFEHYLFFDVTAPVINARVGNQQLEDNILVVLDVGLMKLYVSSLFVEKHLHGVTLNRAELRKKEGAEFATVTIHSTLPKDRLAKDQCVEIKLQFQNHNAATTRSHRIRVAVLINLYELHDTVVLGHESIKEMNIAIQNQGQLLTGQLPRSRGGRGDTIRCTPRTWIKMCLKIQNVLDKGVRIIPKLHDQVLTRLYHHTRYKNQDGSSRLMPTQHAWASKPMSGVFTELGWFNQYQDEMQVADYGPHPAYAYPESLML